MQASRPRAVMGVTLQFDFGLSASDQNLARLLPENARARLGLEIVDPCKSLFRQLASTRALPGSKARRSEDQAGAGSLNGGYLRQSLPRPRSSECPLNVDTVEKLAN